MIDIDGTRLTLEDFRSIVDHGGACSLSESARQKVQRARDLIEEVTSHGEDTPAVYGVNTGFGDLSKVRIPSDQTRLLQRRLVRSHAAGVGAPLPERAVRGMLLLRANTLAQGHSGVRPELIDRLLEMLARGVLPVVPSRGSVGASGDLAPLAHLALPLIGGGKARFDGKEMNGKEAMNRAGLDLLKLEPKEGLSLINGTQAMTSLLAIAVMDAQRQLKIADAVGALSTDALLGTDTPFDPRLHALRPHAGQVASAANLWQLMQGSELRESHRRGDSRVQDPYSIRCMPQVHGAARDVLSDVEKRLTIEMNAVTDNPLVFAEDREILTGGNFHGEPMAMAADFLAIAIAEIGSISERRIDKLTDPVFSGLPAFLTENPGSELGVHDGSGHGGSSGEREQGSGSPGQCRFHPHLRRKGGPCLDGHGGGPEIAAGDLQCLERSRHRAPRRGPGHRFAPAAAVEPATGSATRRESVLTSTNGVTIGSWPRISPERDLSPIVYRSRHSRPLVKGGSACHDHHSTDHSRAHGGQSSPARAGSRKPPCAC